MERKLIKKLMTERDWFDLYRAQHLRGDTKLAFISIMREMRNALLEEVALACETKKISGARSFADVVREFKDVS